MSEFIFTGWSSFQQSAFEDQKPNLGCLRYQVIFQTSFLQPNALIGGLHCCHVGGQNKRKFAHIVCIKMEVNYQRKKM